MSFEQKLAEYQSASLKETFLKDLLKDKTRNNQLLFHNEDFCLDLSREKITLPLLEIFQDEFETTLVQKIKNMQLGYVINSTENRQVLHYLLRQNSPYPFERLPFLEQEVFECNQRIKTFSQGIRSGAIKAFDQKFEHVLSIGIGGSYLGVECVYEALKIHESSLLDKTNLSLHFLSNVDPASAFELIHTLDLKKTLVIVISKTFTTQETIQNLNIMIDAYQTLYAPFKIPKEEIINQHFCAISTNIAKCKATGISEDRIFPLWDWVGGRFSVSSAVGGLPISICLSFEVFTEFLNGMHKIDTLFFNEKQVSLNVPVLLGFLDYFHNHSEKYPVKIIIPYSQPLHRFAAHIQQVEMESNGKRHKIDSNTTLTHDIGKFVFGEPGTNSQHSFFQLLHQGRVSPVEFIGFCNPQTPRKTINGVDCYNEFIVNMFAQMDALAVGCPSEDPARNFTGNRPSFAILFKKELNAFNLGVLLAIYEHRTAVEGFLESINSFDQFGVELGKKLFQEIRGHLKTQDELIPLQGSHPCQLLIDFYNQHTKFE